MLHTNYTLKVDIIRITVLDIPPIIRVVNNYIKRNSVYFYNMLLI